MPSLDWIGKKAVLNHHKEVPFHLLRCTSRFVCRRAGQTNLLVQGDNLLALKALLPYYAGQVRCIYYIDPPYNCRAFFEKDRPTEKKPGITISIYTGSSVR